jgi:hypothetical protein
MSVATTGVLSRGCDGWGDDAGGDDARGEDGGGDDGEGDDARGEDGGGDDGAGADDGRGDDVASGFDLGLASAAASAARSIMPEFSFASASDKLDGSGLVASFATS